MRLRCARSGGEAASHEVRPPAVTVFDPREQPESLVRATRSAPPPARLQAVIRRDAHITPPPRRHYLAAAGNPVARRAHARRTAAPRAPDSTHAGWSRLREWAVVMVALGTAARPRRATPRGWSPGFSTAGMRRATPRRLERPQGDARNYQQLAGVAGDAELR